MRRLQYPVCLGFIGEDLIADEEQQQRYRGALRMNAESLIEPASMQQLRQQPGGLEAPDVAVAEDRSDRGGGGQQAITA